MKIAILGVGAFGYAILKHLDTYRNKKYDLYAYDAEKLVQDHLRTKHKHPRFFPKIPLSGKVEFPRTVEETVTNADIIILAIPSQYIPSMCKQINPVIKNNTIILSVAKALNEKTGERISEIVKSNLSKRYSFAALAGGTIASDLFSHEPLGIDIASTNKKTADLLKKIFHSENLKVYTSTDVIGTEYASAFKNVISILAGITAGIGFCYGSETHIISRTATEVEHIVTTHLGGKKKTFSIASQCWGNDMWMSCTGKTRNREFGEHLGKGKKASHAHDIMKKEFKTVEGSKTIQILNKIIKQTDNPKNYPLLLAVYNIVVKEKDARKELMKAMK